MIYPLEMGSRQEAETRGMFATIICSKETEAGLREFSIANSLSCVTGKRQRVQKSMG